MDEEKVLGSLDRGYDYFFNKSTNIYVTLEQIYTLLFRAALLSMPYYLLEVDKRYTVENICEFAPEAITRNLNNLLHTIRYIKNGPKYELSTSLYKCITSDIFDIATYLGTDPKGLYSVLAFTYSVSMHYTECAMTVKDYYNDVYIRYGDVTNYVTEYLGK